MKQRIEYIHIATICFGRRYRKNYGDLTELAESLKTNGHIQSFAVKEDPDEKSLFKYILLAGGRRFKAAKLAGLTQLPCIVYPADVDNLKMLEIELLENVQRKDFEWAEKTELTDAIHKLEQEIHGVKTVGGPNVEGHSARDTARLLGRSVGSISEDLNLAKAMQQIPEIRKLPNKKAALQFVKNVGKQVAAEEIKAKIESDTQAAGIDRVHELLIKNYKIEPVVKGDYLAGGFYNASPSLRESIVDMVILDIPYALDNDVSLEIAERSSVSNETQTWLTKDCYIPMLKKFLEEAYRLLKPNSWLIVWFGPEPWFEPTYQEIIKAGFECSRNVGLWVKNKGYAHFPQYYLGNAHESFFYARKGKPKIMHQDGKTNLFHYSVPHHTVRIHQTEKPVELEQDIMSTFLNTGDSVLVPCLGSGNAILAGANLGITVWGYDISESMKNDFINNVLASEPPMYRTKKGE